MSAYQKEKLPNFTPPKLVWVLRLAVTAGALIFGLACGPAERMKDISTVSPAPTSTPGEREISGVFNVTGTEPGVSREYNGVLTIKNQGDIHEYRWTTVRGTRVGVGVQMGVAAAVSFSAPNGGKGCGVVLYKIAPDGSLSGKSAMWGDSVFGTEIAARLDGSGFPGKYDFTGTTSDSETYSGKLVIKKDGSGYDFEWIYDKAPVGKSKRLLGFGIWKGSVAAVSFGGRQCSFALSFALYDIESTGNLEGDWGGQKAVTFGIETAKRQ